MYVFYPADELLRIYENPIRRSVPLTVNDDAAVNVVYEDINQQRYQQQSQQSQSHQQQRIVVTNDVRKRKEKKRETSQTAASRRQLWQIVRNGNGGDAGKKEGRRNEEQQARTMQNNRATGSEEAANHPLKDLTQPSLNEPLKQHNGVALKLVQTVSEFAQELGAAMESHSANVRRLVDEFRSRSGDSRVDVGGMRRVWESLLRQVEADAASHLDLAAVLQQQLSRPTLEASFHRKLQSRKVFAHRDAYEQVVSKTEEKLQRTRLDYKRAYAALLTNEAGGGAEQELKRAYLESHNAYILQLRATNAITERYQSHCLPGLLGEIAEVYEELCGLACKCVAGTSDAAGERSGEQAKRYQAVAKEAQAIIPSNDLQTLARNLSVNATPRKPPRRLYVAPAPPEQIPMERISQMPTLRDELVPTGTSTLPLMEDLKRDYDGLNLEIGRLQDALDALVRMQRKSAESNLYTKVAELQEDISLKRLDLGVAQLRLAAVQAQKELFGGGEAGQPDGVTSRKMSNGSTGSPKLKWLKAFKSLKTSSPTTPPLSDKKSLESEGGHTWREYTYRKITPCDACGQVLRGHSRQGVRCRGCKANAHTDCINMVQPALCPSLAPKKGGGIPLLRRQKTQVPADEVPASSEHNVDAIYQVLKQAGEIRGNSTNSPPTPPTAEHPPSGAAPSSARASSHPCSSSTSAPHSPQRRRERLNLRMKSLSLDSPEGSAHVRHRPRDYYAAGPQRETTPPRHSDSGSINRLSPCSPGQSHGIHKHVRSAIRMSSMELPDDNEKSYSSASTSPCPSPHTNNQNHLNPPGKRVLPPNNLYVVLYNFEARHPDELDLKAGYKITVIDKSEKDWWKGKCLGGRAGYFPSAYVMRVESGQRTLQVTRNLQLADQTLLRDQIVIQVGEEVDGVAMVRCAADVRSADHTGKEGDVIYKEILCPLKYLQEV
ncbi:SH3 and cysteine-rich domain-containing protein isoform X2 [Temnothorax americanus]|uniref:SH3 and cysteine-rich domain-containing protein isoform X2 n=1 Tax=Temnothorax americanus TaxID=1964332 RepID=UPI0040692ACA